MERDQASKFVNDLLRLMVSRNGSDLFLTADFPPAIKDDGKITKVSPQATWDVGLVLRTIPQTLPTIDSLDLPQVLKDVAMTKRGLVIFVGATGSGKSTSLAAMVDYRNENSFGHIITIEDPVEFVHPHKN